MVEHSEFAEVAQNEPATAAVAAAEEAEYPNALAEGPSERVCWYFLTFTE